MRARAVRGQELRVDAFTGHRLEQLDLHAAAARERERDRALNVATAVSVGK